MADIFTHTKRSEIMSKIRGRDTAPELLVRRFLFSMGLRYRVHTTSLPGRPDIILRKYGVCVFVHGCFWHGHVGCRFATTPKTNPEFWKSKIDSNRRRDMKNAKALKRLGWRVIVIWGCSLSTSKRQRTCSTLYRRIVRNAPIT